MKFEYEYRPPGRTEYEYEYEQSVWWASVDALRDDRTGIMSDARITRVESSLRSPSVDRGIGAAGLLSGKSRDFVEEHGPAK
jgi:hypothetical protein